MAEDKKSFVLYSDTIGLIRQLPDDVAGRLLKHIYAYVNDESPESDELLLNIAFEPIKQQLKRDLIKYEKKREQWSEAGKKSAEKRALENQRSLDSVERSLTVVDSVATVSTVSVNDNVNVSVSVNDILLEKETKLNIAERKQVFFDSLIPFISIYGKDMLREFYEYWTEHGEKDLKFRKEKEKTFGLDRRLKTWSTNNFNKNQNGKITDTAEFKLFTSDIRASNPNI